MKRPAARALSRRSVLAGFGAAALAACAPRLGPALAAAGAPGGAPDRVVRPPDVPGALPLETGAPVELDMGDHVVLATPFYALTLHKSGLGEGFRWEYDDRRDVSSAWAEGSNYSEELGYVTTGYLSVDPGVEASEPFVVYVQSTWPLGFPLPPQDASLGCVTHVGREHPNGDWNVFVTAADDSCQDWAKYISPGAYAFTLPEEGGTRVYTPAYSVLVPDGWLPDGWSFLYSGCRSNAMPGERGRKLRLFACDADRESNRYAVEFEHCSGYDFHAGAHRCDVEPQGETVGEAGSVVHVVGPWVELGPAVWEPSGEVAAAWAPLVSTGVTRATLASVVEEDTARAWRVETPHYSFDLPEAWRGLVGVALEGEEARVYPLGRPEQAFVRVCLSYSFTFQTSGGPNGEKLLELDSGMGHNVVVWAPPEGAGAGFDPSELLGGLEVAMPAPWRRVYELVPLAESGARPLADFHAEAVEALGGWGSYDWVFELAEDPLVCSWNPNTLPVTGFLRNMLAPIVAVPDVYDLAYTDNGFWSDPDWGTVTYLMSFEVADPSLATVEDVLCTQWAPGRLSGVSPISCGFTAETLRNPEEARRILGEAFSNAIRAYDSPGVSYSVWWCYTTPDGVWVSGEDAT